MTIQIWTPSTHFHDGSLRHVLLIHAIWRSLFRAVCIAVALITGGGGLAVYAELPPALTTHATNFQINASIPDGTAAGLSDTKVFASTIASITNLKVGLTIRGTFNGDLYARLQHSSGRCVLLNRPGRRAANVLGYGDPGVDVVFTDDAALGDVHQYRQTLLGRHNASLGGALTNAWAPDGRTNDPAHVLDLDPRTESLASFTGLDPNGSWTLFVADLEPSDRHTLEGWRLEVTGPPTGCPIITVPPASCHVVCGEAAAFSVSATSEEPLTYRWQRNGVDLEDEGPVSGADTPTLLLASVSLRDAASYMVRVRNTHGEVASDAAVLDVKDSVPPEINAPSSLIVECTNAAGTSAAFELAVSDCDPNTTVVCHPPLRQSVSARRDHRQLHRDRSRDEPVCGQFRRASRGHDATAACLPGGSRGADGSGGKRRRRSCPRDSHGE